MKYLYYILLLYSSLGFSQNIESFPYEKEWVSKQPFWYGNFFSDGSFLSVSSNNTGAYNEYMLDDSQGTHFLITKISSEPELDFAFGFGNNYTATILSAAIDENDHFYLAGFTQMTEGIGTPGTHAPNFAANMTLPETVYFTETDSIVFPPRLCYSSFLVKYDSMGNKIWGTYFNGSREDMAYRVFTKNNEIVIMGNTISEQALSTPGVFMENPSHQLGFNSTTGFIAKFNADNGSLLWASYLPFNSHNSRTEINSRGDVFILIQNESTALYTHSVLKINFDGSNIDEIDLEGSFLTNNNAVAYESNCSLSIDANDNFYLHGLSKSNTNIATANTYRSEKVYEVERFIIKYDQNFNKLWSTYVSDSDIDGLSSSSRPLYVKNKSIYTGGFTSINDLATPGAYQEQIAGDRDQFILKLNDEGQLNWYTYFGGTDDERSIARITLDQDDNLYFEGHTHSPNTEILTENPLFDHPYLGGYKYLAKFVYNPDASTTEEETYRFHLFPNPATDHILLQSTYLFATDTELTVYDLSGRKIHQQQATPANTQVIKTAGWAKGTYLLSVSNGKELQKEFKFVVR